MKPLQIPSVRADHDVCHTFSISARFVSHIRSLFISHLECPNGSRWFLPHCLWLLLAGVTLSACDSNTPNASVQKTPALVVYSSRNEQLIKPLFDAYTDQTGVEIQFITDDAGPLIQRLKSEGRATKADILLTVDAGNLWFAKQQNVLKAVDSTILNKNIPAHLRDPDNFWFGLSVRARTIVYHPDRVAPGELSTYAALAEPQWKERLCLRTSKKVYNQSLVAMMIASEGEKATEQIVRRWIENLAAPVFSSDTKLIEAIAAGQCDVGIVNTYYLGRLINENPDYPVALFWANQNSDGVHVNISGGGVTAHSRHVPAAQEFLEWLATGEAQRQFASVNIEFPVNTGTAVEPLIAAWGTFKPQLINVSRAGELQAAAVRLMDRAGYK